MREVHRLIADNVLLTDAFDAAAAEIVARTPAAERPQGRGGRGRPGRADRRLLPGAARARGHRVRGPRRARRHAALRAAGIPRCPRRCSIARSRSSAASGSSSSSTPWSARTCRSTTWTPGSTRCSCRSAPGRNPGSICPGRNSPACVPRLPFLEGVATGEAMPLGHHVAVIGGGNAAIDSARTAVRLGASATVIYRRERKDMPAIEEEVEAAEQEGVRFQFPCRPPPHRRRTRRGEGRSRWSRPASASSIRPAAAAPSSPTKCG